MKKIYVLGIAVLASVGVFGFTFDNNLDEGKVRVIHVSKDLKSGIMSVHSDGSRTTELDDFHYRGGKTGKNLEGTLNDLLKEGFVIVSSSAATYETGSEMTYVLVKQ